MLAALVAEVRRPGVDIDWKHLITFLSIVNTAVDLYPRLQPFLSGHVRPLMKRYVQQASERWQYQVPSRVCRNRVPLLDIGVRPSDQHAAALGAGHRRHSYDGLSISQLRTMARSDIGDQDVQSARYLLTHNLAGSEGATCFVLTLSDVADAALP
jgi:hypothetical protein